MSEGGGLPGLPGLGGILDGVIGAILGALQFIWNVLVAVANFLWGVIQSIGDFLLSLAKRATAFFHHIWDVVFKRVIGPLIADYQKLHVWLQRTFGPLLRWLNRIYQWYLKHILPIQKRIINIIQRVRVMLELLRLLHVKWASKLDADLQKIQGYITDSIIAVVGTMNKISTVLGLVIDPGMLIRTSAFGGTIWNNLGMVKKAAGYGSSRPIYPDEKALSQGMHDSAFGTAPEVTYGADGTTHFDPSLTLVDQSMTQQARTLGIQP